ncbi:MAG: sialidase [Planctomycetota bacterium]|nr:sialidase [Planctomycetota bacterium]
MNPRLIFFALVFFMTATSPDVACSQAQEEAWSTIKKYFQPPDEFKDDFGRYRSPLNWSGNPPVKTAEQWRKRRHQIRSKWMQLLGEWPAPIRDQQLVVTKTRKRENFFQSTVTFRWTPTAATSGYLLVPQGPGPFPAVITVFYEPETAIGEGKPHRDFAYQLVKRGFVTLSLGTAQATKNQTYALYFPSIEKAEIQPLSMLGYAASNAWYALAQHEKVNPKKIGIVGHSFGGKWAMFSSCLFDQFACAAWSDPGIVFDESRPSVNYWEPWYLGYHPKPWRKRGVITAENPAKGLYPKLVQTGRDLHELHALMAPRPFLVSGGSEDPPQRWQALNHSRAVNQLLGWDNRVGMSNRPEHSPNRDSNEIIYRFFETFLPPND